MTTEDAPQEERPEAPGAEKCGFVAVIGAPNAGKSTFVNRIVGAKVSIVTHKVQTTRARVRGVMIEGTTQLVFIDTPGIFAPKRALDRAMVAAAWEGLDGADATLLLVDAAAMIAPEKREAAQAKRAEADTDLIIEGLKKSGQKAILALNKIDRIPRQPLLELAARMNDTGAFSDIFMISADKGYGVEDLKAVLIERVPAGPWMYPEDQLSDITDRLMAAEVTREKLFLRLHDELPYAATVETERWTRTKKGELRVDQVIYVERDSQKGIVLGRGGQTLKTIGAQAREELAEMLEEPVHLFIQVKVRAGWAEERARLREIGLDAAG